MVNDFCVTGMDQVEFSMADCLARVRQQDRHAARSLVDHLYPLVIKVVRAHRPRRAAEEDLFNLFPSARIGNLRPSYGSQIS